MGFLVFDNFLLPLRQLKYLMLYPCYISAVTVLYLYRKHQLDYLIIKVDFTFFSYNSLSLIEMNHAKGFARERGAMWQYDNIKPCKFDLWGFLV